MRALLILFLTTHLGFADKKAYAIYSLFAAIAYAGPVLGGILADRLLGFRNMVIIGGVIITIGHFMMALIELNSDLVYLGLAFIAVGTGLFKGNITNLLGTYYIKNEEGRSQGFTLFYVSVNLGSFISSLLCGYVANIFGWHYGFGLAGIGMILGLITFISFQKFLGDNGASPYPKLMEKRLAGLSPFSITLAISLVIPFAISIMLSSSEKYANLLIYFGIIILLSLIYLMFKVPTHQRKGLIALSFFIFFQMVFFALEMQLGSLINLFTERNIAKEILGFSIPASMFQAINPLSIIIIGFLLGLYIKFDQKYDIARFALGLATMAICFFILYIGCLNANAQGEVGSIYLMLAISCMGLGELCIAPFVQAQATLLAPSNFRGFIMGVLLLALAFSNLAGVIISEFMSVPSVNGAVDILQSLEIYKKGFLDIALFNLLFVAIFLLLVPFIRRMMRQSISR